MLLFLNEFAKWILIANFIAWPIVWYSMRMWLQDFAYRTDLNVLIFISAGLIALFIEILSVSYQSIKAALSNPIESLRYE